jgi:hypothetical protein
MTGMIKTPFSFVLIKQPDNGIVPELHQGSLRTTDVHRIPALTSDV